MSGDTDSCPFVVVLDDIMVLLDHPGLALCERNSWDQFHFPAQLTTSRNGNHAQSFESDDHTHIFSVLLDDIILFDHLELVLCELAVYIRRFALWRGYT